MALCKENPKQAKQKDVFNALQTIRVLSLGFRAFFRT